MAVTSVSYVSHATSNGTGGGAGGITFPAVNAGDVAAIWAAGGIFAPTGFTAFDGGSNRFFYRVCDGTEDGTLVQQGGADFPGVLIVFRANEAVTSLLTRSGGDVSTGDTNNDPAQQTLNASAGVAPVVGITAFRVNAPGVVDPRTTSITPTVEIGWGAAGNRMYVHAYIQNSSPANYTWDMDDEGTANRLDGNYLHSFNNTTISSPLSASGTGTATLRSASTNSQAIAFTGTGTASLRGNAIVPAPFSLTGTGAADFVSGVLSTEPAPFSMTGTGTASFAGALSGASPFSATGTGTATFSGNVVAAVAAAMSGAGTATFLGGTSVVSAADMTATASVSFVGLRSGNIGSIRDTITPKGAVSVTVH